MNGYNFTEGVRRVLQAARQQAAELGHEYVGTEHILLGLLNTDDGVPSAVLHSRNVDPASLREAILETLDEGKPGRALGPDLPYTSRAKKVLEESMTEARELSHTYVGTEHILLGLLRERKGVAARCLTNAGLTEETVRSETIRIFALGELGGSRPSRVGRPAPGSISSSFLIVIEDPSGQLGAQKFTNPDDAIEFIKKWRDKS